GGGGDGARRGGRALRLVTLRHAGAEGGGDAAHDAGHHPAAGVGERGPGDGEHPPDALGGPPLRPRRWGGGEDVGDGAQPARLRRPAPRRRVARRRDRLVLLVLAGGGGAAGGGAGGGGEGRDQRVDAVVARGGLARQAAQQRAAQQRPRLGI